MRPSASRALSVLALLAWTATAAGASLSVAPTRVELGPATARPS